jgi:hypothetical protein
MAKDLFVVTGCLDDLRNRVNQLSRQLNKPNEDDINWEKINDIAFRIEDAANVLQDESEE